MYLNSPADILSFSDKSIMHAGAKLLPHDEKKLAKLKRQLSRKTKDSSNYKKACFKIAKLNEHVFNQRKDVLHKLSTEIIRQNDTIYKKILHLRRQYIRHYHLDLFLGRS